MIGATHPRISVFRRFVEDLASLSKCTDKQVAAIIIDSEATQVYSIGINGGPRGGLDCLCSLGGKYTCAHAEANAIAKCKVDCTGATMICTMSPCVTCATLIVNSGITQVYYINKYKDETGPHLLEHAGVNVVWLDDPGMPRPELTHYLPTEYHDLWKKLVADRSLYFKMYIGEEEAEKRALEALAQFAIQKGFKTGIGHDQASPGTTLYIYKEDH